MRPVRRTLVVAGAAVLSLAVASSIVSVDVTEYGVIMRFGRIARVVGEPGLTLKRPYPLERVVRLDRRLLTLKPATAEYLSEDKKNLVIHSLVTWRIAEPAKFLAAVGTRAAAETRLADIVLARIGAVTGTVSSAALVSLDRQRAELERVMGRVVSEARAAALDAYGIEVADVRLRQVTLPEQNRANVFARMQAERGKIAMKYRSEGERESRKIIAGTDRERTRIMAEAYREAERSRAEGDAEATRIYAEAFARNPRFYKFLRTLQAYEKILDANTTVVLPADAGIFKVLNERQRPAAPR
jgi:membrane protease subunit HflC